MENATRKDIEELKENWRKDPCWDIEDSKGFEAFREELLAYREEQEAAWAASREKKIEKMREEAGRKICPMSIPGREFVKCRADSCMWWCNRDEICAIVCIAVSVDKIFQGLPGIGHSYG